MFPSAVTGVTLLSPAQLAAVPAQTGPVLVTIPILFSRESHCSSENIRNHFTEGSASPRSSSATITVEVQMLWDSPPLLASGCFLSP